MSIADSAIVTTKSVYGTNGTWLIDPDGFTISGNGDMTGGALTNALKNGNVTIASTSGSSTDGTSRSMTPSPGLPMPLPLMLPITSTSITR